MIIADLGIALCKLHILIPDLWPEEMLVNELHTMLSFSLNFILYHVILLTFTSFLAEDLPLMV